MADPIADEPLTQDILFLACTRPTLIAGVPMEAMGLNLMISATAFLAGHSLLYLLVAPAAHLVSAGICRHEPNAFRLLWLWAERRGQARTSALWGGVSRTPLPLRRRGRAEDLVRG